MTHGVLIPNMVAAKNIDTYNASFVSTTDVDNGALIVKGDISSDASEGQVFEATLTDTANTLGVWMAFSPEDTILVDGAGNQYKIGILDPRTFTNVAGLVFSAFKPQVEDIITVAGGITGVSALAYAIIDAANDGKLVFSATANASGTTFKVLETTYISIASANAYGSQRVTAYKLQCTNN